MKNVFRKICQEAKIFLLIIYIHQLNLLQANAAKAHAESGERPSHLTAKPPPGPRRRKDANGCRTHGSLKGVRR